MKLCDFIGAVCVAIRQSEFEVAVCCRQKSAKLTAPYGLKSVYVFKKALTATTEHSYQEIRGSNPRQEITS
jgi:hypothetical protein